MITFEFCECLMKHRLCVPFTIERGLKQFLNCDILLHKTYK